MNAAKRGKRRAGISGGGGTWGGGMIAGTVYTQTVPLVDAATINYVASASDNFTLLLTALVGATRQLAAPSGLVAGMRWVVRVKQPAAGGPCNVTFPAAYKFPYAQVPALSTTPNAIDTISCYYDGTNIIAIVVYSYGTPSGLVVSGSTLDIVGGVKFDNVLVNSLTPLDDTHHTVCVDASAGPVTIELPDTATVSNRRRKYTIKKVDATANAVTIQRTGADLIDGATTVVITTQYQSRTVHSRNAGGVWDVV